MADRKTFWNTPTATGGALTGGLMDGIGSLFTIGAQKRAATTAWNRQNEFWDRQNAYNTPANQMKRLKDAGLNPALMYGQGNVGNAERLSGVQKANVQGPQLAQSVAAGAQMSLVNAQRRNIDADTAEKKKGTELKGATINKVIAEISNINYKNQLIKVQTIGEKYNNTRNIGTLQQDIKISGQILKQLYLDNALTQQTWTGLVNEQIGLGLQAIQKNKLLGRQVKLTDKQIEKLDTEICAINEKIAIDWRNSDSAAIQADASEYANEVRQIVMQMDIDQRQKELLVRSLTTIVSGLIGKSKEIVTRKK